MMSHVPISIKKTKELSQTITDWKAQVYKAITDTDTEKPIRINGGREFVIHP